MQIAALNDVVNSMVENYDRYANFWINELAQFQLSNFNSLRSAYTSFSTPLKSLKRKSLLNQVELLTPKTAPEYFVLTTCLLYLYKINNYDTVSIWFSYPELKELTSGLEEFLSTYVPLTVHFTPDIRFDDALNLVKEKISALKANKTYIHKQNKNNPTDAIDSNSQIRIELINTADIARPNISDDSVFYITSNKNTFRLTANSTLPSALQTHILCCIKNLSQKFTRTPHTAINSFSLLNPVEKQILIQDWNDTKSNNNLNITINTLFEKHAHQFPHSIAANLEGKKITYGMLDQLANQFANYLIKKGIKPKSFVAIFLERSIELLIVMLGILKAGAAYVPIDTKYPINRIKYIIKDSKCAAVITKNKLLNDKVYEIQTLSHIIKLDLEEKFIKQSPRQLSRNKINNSKNFAYLIYTSGSTGEPKGILITHRNVLNYRNWFAEIFKLTKKSIIDFSSSIGFDLSVSCTLVPLMTGARVEICSEENKINPLNYLEHLTKNNVTHIECTPHYFNHLLAFPNQVKKLTKLQWIMLGADNVIKKDIERWLALRPKDKLANEYGPTECTVAITAYIATKDNINNHDNITPIGKPAFNTQVYIVDKYGNLCSVGVPGELYVSGESVAAGYLDNNLTNNSFIKNPFNKTKKFFRVYKTGDVVRWLPDGNIEFLGRYDDQVKIRGFRIELHEIEKYLLQNPYVQQCKIIPRMKSDGEKILVAYIKSTDKKNINPNKLRVFLQHYLPKYMLPSSYVFLNKFPTNDNDKVDLKLLSQIEEKPRNKHLQNTMKINDHQEKIRQIWSRVLSASSIKLKDNFFEIGGDSSSALRILNEIDNSFHIRLPVQTIFKHPTVLSLSKAIQSLEKTILILNDKATADDNKEPQVICLQSKGKMPPLFLIHPVGGTIFLYKNLANLLGKQHPIYGLQDPGIEKPDIRFTDIQEMASYYLRAIKKIQNHGPYLLAGASFGATVVVELARQLNLLGERVPFVGLLDGWAVHSKKIKDKKFFHNLMQEKLRGFDKKYANALLEMQHSRELMLFDYKIPELNENITLFKAKDLWPMFNEINSKLNGWENYFKSPISLHTIPGDHESMFLFPNSKLLAKSIKNCLHQIFF